MQSVSSGCHSIISNQENPWEAPDSRLQICVSCGFRNRYSALNWFSIFYCKWSESECKWGRERERDNLMRMQTMRCWRCLRGVVHLTCLISEHSEIQFCLREMQSDVYGSSWNTKHFKRFWIVIELTVSLLHLNVSNPVWSDLMTEMDFWNLRGAADPQRPNGSTWSMEDQYSQEEELPVQVEATEWSVSLLRVFKNFIARPDKLPN